MSQPIGWDAAVVTTRPMHNPTHATQIHIGITSRSCAARDICGSTACNLESSGTWSTPLATS